MGACNHPGTGEPVGVYTLAHLGPKAKGGTGDGAIQRSWSLGHKGGALGAEGSDGGQWWNLLAHLLVEGQRGRDPGDDSSAPWALHLGRVRNNYGEPRA